MAPLPAAHWSADTHRLSLTGPIDHETLPVVLELIADCAHAGPVDLDLGAAVPADPEVDEVLRQAGLQAARGTTEP